MMLTDPKDIDPSLIGQHPLRDDIANHLRLRQQVAVRASGDVAKSVQPELDCVHRLSSGGA
jgi:hypothetical protein